MFREMTFTAMRSSRSVLRDDVSPQRRAVEVFCDTTCCHGCEDQYIEEICEMTFHRSEQQ